MSLILCIQLPGPGICSSSDALKDESIKATSPIAENDRRISYIRIVGNVRISEAQIRLRVKSKSGDKYDREALVRDLRSINDMGCFYDRSLLVEPKYSGNNEISVTIHVKENPTWFYQNGLLPGQIIRFGYFNVSHFPLPARDWGWNFRKIDYMQLVSSRPALRINGQILQKNFKFDSANVGSFIQNETDTLNGYDALQSNAECLTQNARARHNRPPLFLEMLFCFPNL